MAKIGLFALVLGFVGVLAGTTLSETADAAKACKRTKFETKLVEDACKKGGQSEAKKVMKAWVKDAKKKQSNLECKTCHSKLAPAYDLKPDGLEKFKDLGGK